MKKIITYVIAGCLAISGSDLFGQTTTGGLVTRLAGRVPGRGELVKHSSGIEFEVIEGDPRRIRQLRLRGLPTPAPAGK